MRKSEHLKLSKKNHARKVWTNYRKIGDIIKKSLI